jgi:hypothetical protein
MWGVGSQGSPQRATARPPADLPVPFRLLAGLVDSIPLGLGG